MTPAEASAAGAAGALVAIGGLALAGWVLSARDAWRRRSDPPATSNLDDPGWAPAPPPPPPVYRGGVAVYRCTAFGCPLNGETSGAPHAHRRRLDGGLDVVHLR